MTKPKDETPPTPPKPPADIPPVTLAVDDVIVRVESPSPSPSSPENSDNG
jgi:hypothetical protein